MTIGTILLGLALLALVALYLARPFLAPDPQQHRTTRRQSLLTQKELFLDQIRALDFDFDTNKVPEAVYKKQREHLFGEAKALLQQLDELESHLAADSSLANSSDAVDAEIEAAIARLRQARPRATDGNGHAAYCTQCGQPAGPGDKFCAYCGHKIHARQST